jgi:hypothetical protein
VLESAVPLEVGHENLVYCAGNFRRDWRDSDTSRSPKLSVVRAIRTDSQRSHELRLYSFSAVPGHYQRDWWVLRPK